MSNSIDRLVYPVNLRYSTGNTCIMEYFTDDLRLVARRFFCTSGVYAAVRKKDWRRFAELVSLVGGPSISVETRATDIDCSNRIMLHRLYEEKNRADEEYADNDNESAAESVSEWQMVFVGTRDNEQAEKMYKLLRENCQYCDFFCVLPEHCLEVNMTLVSADFTMMCWCTMDWESGRIESLHRAADDVMLPDPVKHAPLLSFDIEVVCDELDKFPVGMHDDEQISSVSVVVAYSEIDDDGRSRPVRRNVVYVLRPFWYDDHCMETVGNVFSDAQLSERFAASIERERDEKTQVLWFPDERSLLEKFMSDLESNALVEDVSPYSIVVGYNSDMFDMVYLSKRIWFHDLHRFSSKIFSSSFVPSQFRFGYAHDRDLNTDEERDLVCLYFDLFKIVSNHMSVDLPNKKLSTVAKKFGKGEGKVDMNPTAIRYMYSRSLWRPDRAALMSHEDGTLVNENGIDLPTMGRVIRYNIVDSAVLVDVIEQQNIIDMVLEFSHMSVTNGFVSLVKGKSHMTNRLVLLEYLKNGSFLGNLDCTVAFRNFCVQQFVPRDEQDLHAMNQGAVSQLDLLRFGAKRFGGGANDALQGVFLNAASGDYKSFYPSMAVEKNFGLANTAVLTSEDVLEMFERSAFENPQMFGLQQYCDAERVLDSDGQAVVPLPSFGQCDRYVFVDVDSASVVKKMFERLMHERDICKKLKESDPSMAIRERVLKLIVNSAYGTLGYEKSVTKAVVVAASITNGCRMQINKTCQELIERGLKPIYVDTDGVYYVPTEKFLRGRVVITESENRDLCRQITETIGSDKLILEPENVYDVIVIMARKTYMYADDVGDGSVRCTCKGFEKNAPLLIKNIFRKLAAALMAEIDFVREKYGNIAAGSCLVPRRFDEKKFAYAVFNYLNTFPAEKFKKEIALNERSVGGEKTEFIEECVRRGHQRGSRIDYLDVYNRVTRQDDFCVADEFRSGGPFVINLGLFVKNHFGYMSKCLGVLERHGFEGKATDSKKLFDEWSQGAEKESPYDVWFSAPDSGEESCLKPKYSDRSLLDFKAV